MKLFPIAGCGILFLLLESVSYGQVITIRVIDIRNGKPLEKQHVSILIIYDRDETTPTKYDKVVKLETDIEGMAQIRLPEPLPGTLQFGLRMTLQHWHYVSGSMVSTKKLTQQGIELIPTEKRKSDCRIKAKAGEIVFLVRPFSFFERLFYPVMKEL